MITAAFFAVVRITVMLYLRAKKNRDFMNDINETIGRQREYFGSGATRPVEFRRETYIREGRRRF